MKYPIWISTLLLLLAVAHSAEVISITKDNIEKVLTDNQFVIIDFYADKCKFCEELEPEYNKAAQHYTNNEIVFAKVDAAEDFDLAESYDARGFPTVLLFNNARKGKKPQEYEGPKKADDLIKWLDEKLKRKVATFQTQEDVEQHIKANPKYTNLVYYGAPNQSELYQAFVALLYEQDGVYFANVQDEQERAKAGLTGPKRVVLYKSFEEPKVVFDLQADKLEQWLTYYGHLTQGPISAPVVQMLFQTESSVLLLLAKKSQDHSLELFKDIADQLKYMMIRFLWADETNQFWSELLEFTNMGEEKQMFPKVVLLKFKDGFIYKYKYETVAISQQMVKDFLQNYLANKLKPFMRSQEPPKENKGPVKVVVGKTFNEIVLNNDKDVLIMFYAPWCEHCKKFLPEFEQLGQILQSHDKVVVAKMDATANDVERVSPQGYPSFYMYINGRKQTPLEYRGELTIEKLKETLRQYTSHDWPFPVDEPEIDPRNMEFFDINLEDL